MFVEAKRSFNKPKSYLLDVIKEPGNLSYYHPFCKRHEAIQWPGPGSIDELEYLNGRTLIRDFFNWHENCINMQKIYCTSFLIMSINRTISNASFYMQF